MTEIRFIERQFQKVSVGADDVIVLQYPSVLSDKAYERIIGRVGRQFPDHTILILEEGMTIGVMSPESTQKSSEPPHCSTMTLSENKYTAFSGGLF